MEWPCDAIPQDERGSVFARNHGAPAKAQLTCTAEYLRRRPPALTDTASHTEDYCATSRLDVDLVRLQN